MIINISQISVIFSGYCFSIVLLCNMQIPLAGTDSISNGPFNLNNFL